MIYLIICEEYWSYSKCERERIENNSNIFNLIHHVDDFEFNFTEWIPIREFPVPINYVR